MLTPKQAKFVEEYLKDMNASAAAERAGYSKKTAYAIGHENLRKLEIISALQDRLKEISAATGITPERVIQGFGHGAYYDPADLYYEDMRLKSIHDIPKEARMAITSLDVEELFVGSGEDQAQIGHIKKIKFCERHKYLESLAKHFGLYNADESGKFRGVIRVVYDDKPPLTDDEE